MDERMVMVTTEKRGVFAGRLLTESEDGSVVELADAQMCVYWSPAVRGVIGLAATGPDAQSRITQLTPRAKLFGVTAICDLTAEAAAAWRACPWG